MEQLRKNVQANNGQLLVGNLKRLFQVARRQGPARVAFVRVSGGWGTVRAPCGARGGALVAGQL